jgi:hypothetical protein
MFEPHSARRVGVGWLAIIPVLVGVAAVANAQEGTTATGSSREMNPAISVNGLFLGEYERERSSGEEASRMAMQELELAAISVVDPYFKASVFVSLGYGHGHETEHDHDGEHAEEHEEHAEEEASEEHSEDTEHDHGVEVALEEAFVQTLTLPAGLGVRAGKVLAPFGRMNRIHLHHLPFIEMQHGFSAIIAPHGVADVGLEAAYSPLVPWYLDLRLFLANGNGELFREPSNDLAVTGRIENLWDLGEATTFELAGSAWTGPAQDGGTRTFYGGDTRLKWRDVRKTHGRVFEVLAEYLVDDVDAAEDQRALISLARYRFARRWWLSGGYSFYDHTGEGTTDDHEYKAQIAFLPSHFSAIRFDTTYLAAAGGERVLTLQLQLNFTIGSHPAHVY